MTWYTFNSSGIAFDQDFQVEIFFVGQVGGTVGQGVGLFFRCDRQRSAHALTRFDVPGLSVSGRRSGLAPQS